ncbi:MAG TPA: helix-turn-helix domain-containing protein [Thermoplasmata archaeon]|nr:helix-turn-helix domain-containing protein [Thermoplasmata archaeon]
MRRAPVVRLHWEQLRQLRVLAEDRDVAPRIGRRARIVLRASEGATDVAISSELNVSTETAALWRRRFLAHGVAGLKREAPRSGRPPVITPQTVRAVVRATRERAPPNGQRWSARSLAREFGVSKSSVQRIWSAHELPAPGRRPRPPPDTEMGFLDRVTDLVGLYLHSPERAVAFSTDERLSTNRPPPLEGRALSVLRRHSRGEEFRAFLQVTERETPPHLDVHLLVDSRLAPVPPEVERWLARRPRVHLHFLPEDGAGAGFIDRLIDRFSKRRDRPGASPSAHRLKYALRGHLSRDRELLRPFVWTATAEEVRGAYGRQTIS